jgi:hypothetical protein
MLPFGLRGKYSQIAVTPHYSFLASSSHGTKGRDKCPRTLGRMLRAGLARTLGIRTIRSTRFFNGPQVLPEVELISRKQNRH